MQNIDYHNSTYKFKRKNLLILLFLWAPLNLLQFVFLWLKTSRDTKVIFASLFFLSKDVQEKVKKLYSPCNGLFSHHVDLKAV